MSHFYRGMIFLPCENVYLCRLNKETDTGMEIRKQYFKEKQYMWHKVRELQLKGLNKTQIGIYLGVNRKTV
ncbi:IS21 family transposase, partial [Bacteroides fragilis]|nr:IS21 family transposase [Bacteroides fragilis]